MTWIISAGKDIIVDDNQQKARLKYIRQVTKAEVSDWQPIQVNGCRFLCCVSNDTLAGTFITAHINEVFLLSTIRQICQSKIIVANTCIVENFNDKKLLFLLCRINPSIELYFAKQELSIDQKRILWQTTTLDNVGKFGFQSSLSERELFMSRRKGLEESIKLSFVRVSPIFE